MAGEINFGILDTSIPSRIANSFQEGQEMRRKNALAELAYGQAMQAQEDDKAYRSAYQQSAGDMNALQRMLGERGLGKQAMALQSQLLEQEAKRATIGKDKAAAAKSALDVQMQQLNRTSQLIASAKDQDSYLRAKAIAAKEFGPESVANIPDVYDPAIVQQLADATRTQQEKVMEELRRMDMGVTMRGQDMTAATSRRGQDMTYSATVRGQNMTDARAKEANGIASQMKALQLDEAIAKRDDRIKAKQSDIAGTEAAISVIDKAISHPGRETATGMSGKINPANYIPGTEAVNFQAVLDQIGGTAFLQAFQSLKGGGAITEVEGKKATDAIARLNRAQSDSEFLTSLQDLREVMTKGYERMAGKSYDKPAPAANGKQPAAAPQRVASDADYNSLPSGAIFVGPDGKTRRKP